MRVRCGRGPNLYLLIEDAREQAHIDNIIAYIHRCCCRGDISIKVKLRVLLIEDGLGSSNIKD